MQIAQIAPLTEAIPPKLYGGTERVISWLTDELVALGHDVMLFASGDSQTAANLEAFWPTALRLDGSVRDLGKFSCPKPARATNTNMRLSGRTVTCSH